MAEGTDRQLVIQGSILWQIGLEPEGFPVVRLNRTADTFDLFAVATRVVVQILRSDQYLYRWQGAYKIHLSILKIKWR